jgi:uncharacterized protein YukE
MAVSEELIVRIRGDLRDIETKLNRLERESGQTARTMSRQFQQAGRQMGQAFAALRGPALATGAVAAGIGLISRRSLEATETLQDLADRANVSAQFLQELRFVTNQSGASARDFDDAISRLNRRLGLFQQNLATGEGEAGPAAAAFRALGLEADIASGRLANTEQVFAAVVAGLQSVENESQKAALASQLFGEDSGPRLVGLLNRGTEGIRELSQEMREMGIVMSNEVVAAAAATSDELEVLETIVTARLNDAVARNADGVRAWTIAWTDLRVALIDVAGGLGELWGGLSGQGAPSSEASALERAMFDTRNEMSRLEEQSRRLQETLENPATYEFRREALQVQIDSLQSEIAELEQTYNDLAAVASTSAQTRAGALRELAGFGLGADDVLSTIPGAPPSAAPEPAAQGKDYETMRSAITNATVAAVGFGDELKEVEEAGEEVRRKTSEIAEEIDRTPGFTRMIESAMTLEDALVSSIKAFEDTLVDAITEGKLEFDDLARHILRTFARMAVQQYITGPIARFASAVFGAGPGKATGGPASGMTLVGEQGPELVNLGPMANVMTANMTKAVMQGDMRRGGSGGAVSITNSYTIDARGADAGAESRIRQAIQEASAVSAAQAEARTLRAITSAQRNRRAY